MKIGDEVTFLSYGVRKYGTIARLAPNGGSIVYLTDGRWLHRESVEVLPEMWEVIVAGENGYSSLDHKGRTTWRKKTAMKRARDFKAKHLRDAWVQEVT